MRAALLTTAIVAPAAAAVLGAGCGKDASSGLPSTPAGAAALKTATYKPQHAFALELARRTTENLEHDPSGPRPAWVLYDPKGNQLVVVGDDVGNQRALKIAQTYDVDRATRVGAPPSPVTYGADPLATAPPLPPPTLTTPPPVAGVHAVDPTHIEIDRAVVDKLAADPMPLMQSVRIVPSIRNGAANGFKLYAIRPGSVVAALGLQNGDTITELDGFDLTTPDKALEAYTHVTTGDHHELRLERRGTDLTFSYTIK